MGRIICRTASVLALVLVTLPCTAAAQGSAPPPAANGSSCIAVAWPSVKGASDAVEFAGSLRDLFVSYLSGPTLRAIPLEARLASQGIEEARQKECDRVLLTSIERKRHDGGGWGQALGRAAGSAAVYGVPYGGTAATAAARGAAIAGAYAVAQVASTTKAKDEVTIEYRFGSLDSVTRVAARIEKAKAKSDGEDLLTPLVEKASEAVATAAKK